MLINALKLANVLDDVVLVTLVKRNPHQVGVVVKR